MGLSIECPGGGKNNGKNEKVGKINEKAAFLKGKSEKVGKKYDFQKKGGGEIK